jgi:hypothetical protein
LIYLALETGKNHNVGWPMDPFATLTIFQFWAVKTPCNFKGTLADSPNKELAK